MTRITTTGPDHTTYPYGRRSPDGARYVPLSDPPFRWGKALWQGFIGAVAVYVIVVGFLAVTP